jgi:hypothetical protein
MVNLSSKLKKRLASSLPVLRKDLPKGLPVNITLPRILSIRVSLKPTATLSTKKLKPLFARPKETFCS